MKYICKFKRSHKKWKLGRTQPMKGQHWYAHVVSIQVIFLTCSQGHSIWLHNYLPKQLPGVPDVLGMCSKRGPHHPRSFSYSWHNTPILPFSSALFDLLLFVCLSTCALVCIYPLLMFSPLSILSRSAMKGIYWGGDRSWLDSPKMPPYNIIFHTYIWPKKVCSFSNSIFI